MVLRIVTFFAPELCHAVETMAYFLAIDGACCVRVATRCDGDEKTEHPWTLRRIREFGGIEIAPHDSASKESDILVFYLVRNGKISTNFAAWCARAKSAVYLSPTEGPLSWQDWLRETVRSFPHYIGARKMRYSPYIHPELIANSEWLKASFGRIDADGERRWRVGFLGNRQPPERLTRLVQCKHAVVGAEHRVKWHEYGGWESVGSRGLEPMEYMEVLSDMDFCISPPGWGGQWTHRTIEALVRGSIPIIEDPQIYGLELCHGENCIVAKPSDWGTAVRSVLDIAKIDILRMRRNVITLRDEKLLPCKAINRLRSQLFA